jgi:hypothetical protein
MNTPPENKVDPKLPSMQPKRLTGNCRAKVIASSCKLGAAALDLNLDLPCHEYMKALLAHKLRTDAIKFIAAWLPPRDALWFGCLGVWQVDRLSAQPGFKGMGSMVVNYITAPTLEGLSNFGNPKDATRANSPLGLLCQAVIYSGNNLCPYPKKIIKPDASLVGKTVANALILAATKWPGKDRNACLEQFIDMGLDIAEGKHLWGPNPGQNYPGLRQATNTGQMFGKTRNIWED